jgi:hypothetical protein
MKSFDLSKFNPTVKMQKFLLSILKNINNNNLNIKFNELSKINNNYLPLIILYVLWLFRFFYWTWIEHRYRNIYMLFLSYFILNQLSHHPNDPYLLVYSTIIFVGFYLLLNVSYNYYAPKKFNFSGVYSGGVTGHFQNGIQTNLIPEYISFNGRRFDGWEEIKSSTKYIFKKFGWESLSHQKKKELAFQFISQHMLLSYEINHITPGFASGNLK